MPIPSTKILFRGVSILDSTGADPYPGDVLVENDRILTVGTVDDDQTEGARVIEGRGRTLMSGLCDAHTHFSWNNSADLEGLGCTPTEEHLLFCLESAKTFLDFGYTMCVGAASAKERLDVVVRDAINAGRFPGPRYLANGPEIAVTGGAIIRSITKFADGPEGMRKAVRELVAVGVDQIKLSMTGEEIADMHADDTYFSEEECAAAVAEAHRFHKRVCAHARSAESVKMCLRNGVDIIYHASYIDDEGMDMLEAKKDSVFVAPAINWLVATLYEASSFGFPQEAAEAVGYKRELDCAIKGLQEMHRRGIRVLPGGTTASRGPPTAPMPAICSTSSNCWASLQWKSSSPRRRREAKSCCGPTNSGRSNPDTSPICSWSTATPSATSRSCKTRTGCTTS